MTPAEKQFNKLKYRDTNDISTDNPVALAVLVLANEMRDLNDNLHYVIACLENIDSAIRT
jgi:hypothetical protein